MLMKLAPQKHNPRNFYLSVAAAIFILCVGRYFAIESEREKGTQLALLAQQLSQLNATLPKKVDGLTTLEYVGLSSSDTIFYRYQVNMKESTLSEEERANMEAGLRSGLERLACKETKFLAAMRKYNIHMEHFYRARDGELFTIEIHADQLNCPEPKR